MPEDLPDLGARKTLAKTLARNLIRDAKIKTAPVSLQRVIEHLQGSYDLEVRRMDVSGKVSGLIVICRDLDSEFATIGFNSNHPWCRRRFTIAHEIGHLLLNHTCTGKQNDGTHYETEANVFASELLVPRGLIKKDFARLQDARELSKLYRVSDQTISIALIEGRLL